jgi:hypothetical protein
MNKLMPHTATLCAALVLFGCGADKSDRSDDASSGRDSGSPESPAANSDKPAEDKPDKDASMSNSEDIASGSKGSMAAADSCDPACKEPATCSERDGASRCNCPDGYDDVKGDGSQCEDTDECAGDAPPCDSHATCKNTPGSYECSCSGPSYSGDGKSCDCADGYEKADDLCLARDGGQCSDNLDCANGHCVEGICCAQACGTPGAECETAEGATCQDGKTCKYAVAKDGAACDDGDACTVDSVCKGGSCQRGPTPQNCDDKNPCTDDSCDPVVGCKNANNTATCDDGNACTEGDRCGNGRCGSTTLRDCSASADPCNQGVCDPADGACKKRPVADGVACDDANSCSVSDRCTTGTCSGGNACGPNATGCMAGAVNTCTCSATFHESTGKCVPDNDECAATPSPCGTNATCFDPSNAAGDVTCTCSAGYKGDGHTCVLIEPCANNPCGEGRGTCTPGNDGTHTCTCGAGYLAVGDTCVCDMNGTFALRSTLNLSWAVQSTIEAGSDTQTAWVIERHSYGKDGSLMVETISCGETNLDLCGEGVGALVPEEAYAQYVPVNVWGRPGAPSTQYQSSIAPPLPTAKFELAQHASLGGISLTDPLGAWPTAYKDVEGTPEYDGSATNGARWIDSDNDGVFGLTTYTVGPNGVAADGSDLAPISAYGTHSTVCPRSKPDAARLPYNYPPSAEGLTVRRVKRFFSANRAISGLSGTINSCDDITGEITGPDNGHVHFDTRIGGCLRANGDADTACSKSIVDFLDANNAPNEISANPFVMKRVADDVTCAQVRAMPF